MYTIKLQRCRHTAEIPVRATEGSAAYDFMCPEDTRVHYGRQIIPMGWKTEFTRNIGMDSRTRAGYAAYGLKVYDRWDNEWRIDADVIIGLIDSDYRGEVGTILHVRSLLVLFFGWLLGLHVKKGQVLSQICFWFVPDTTIALTNSLTDTSRGDKGFGRANNEGR